MSDAKSTPFMHVIKSKYTPKVTKKPNIRANNAKFANHFLFHTMVNGTLKIYSELSKIHTIHRPSSRTKFCIPSGKIAKYAKYVLRVMLILANFAQFALLKITQATTNSVKSALYLLVHNNFII